MVLVAGAIGAQTVGGGPGDASDVLSLLGQIVFASVPFTFLAGLLRSRVARADAVGALLVQLGEGQGTDGLRCRLADALGDPTLQLLYWVDEGWVRKDGRAAELPEGSGWTVGRARGQRVGAIVHDRSLEPESLASVAAAAGPRDALRAPRGRAAALARAHRRGRPGQERRRLERNLHDGAQQRLVALCLHPSDRPEPDRQVARQGGELVGAAQEELTRALEELRELARGIHPAVLSDRGLQAAVEALAVRSPLPVKLVEVPGERLPEPVEAAAYFVIAEALTNVAKYANANAATVAVRRINGHARSKYATMVWAEQIPAAARVCAASPTASAHWMVPWHSTRHPGRALLSERRSPYEHRRYAIESGRGRGLRAAARGPRAPARGLGLRCRGPGR